MSDDAEEINAPPGFADGTAFAPDDAPAPEGDAPAVEPEAPPVEPAPVVPAPAAPTPAPDPAKGLLRDLQAERQSRQDAQREVERLKGVVEGIERAAARGPQAPAGPIQLTPQQHQKAATWAHRWGLYTTDGQPDVAAAHTSLEELRADMRGDTEAAVQAGIRPVTQVLQTAHAQAQKAEILGLAKSNGIDTEILGTYLDRIITVQPDLLGNAEAVFEVFKLAAGEQALRGGRAPVAPTVAAAVAAAVTPPVPNRTESPGRPLIQAKALAGLERQIATKRGISNETWGKNSDFFEKNMDASRGLVVED